MVASSQWTKIMDSKNSVSILLVDDIPDNLLLLERMLSSLEYRLVKAYSGQEAIALAKEEDFALILLDVNMPRLDGFATAEGLRLQSRSSTTPIIFLTATESSDMQLFNGYESGAVDYLIKPLNVKILLNKIGVFIRLFQQQEELKQKNLTLQKTNQQLQEQFQECQLIEAQLQSLTVHLEELIEQRTQELKESELLYRVVLSSIADAIFITNDQGDFTFVCPGVDAIFGYHYDEIKQMGNIQVLLGNPFQNDKQWDQQKDIINLEQDIVDKAGQIHSLLINIKKVSIQNGSRLYCCRDITERKQMMEKIERSEKQYRHLLEHIQSGVVVHAPNTQITYANPAATTFLGLIEQELQGKSADSPDWHFYHGDASLMSPSDFPVNKVIREGKPLLNYEVGVYRTEFKDVSWAWVNAYPELDHDGTLLQVIVTFIDITERKKTEFALHNLNEELERMVEERTKELEATNTHLLREMIEREQVDLALQGEEAKYRALMKDASDAIFVLDIQRRVLEVNQKAELLTGYSRDELVALPQGSLIPTHTYENAKNLWQSILENRLGFWSDAIILQKNKTSVPVDITGSVIEYEGKKIVQLIVRDITDRKRSEAALQKSEAQFRAIFEKAAIGIALVNPLGYPYQANLALTKILGYTESELSQNRFIELTYPEDREQDRRLFQRLIKGEQDTYQLENRYLRFDGTVVWTYMTASLVRNAKGQPQFAVRMVEDISERKQAEQSLQQNQIFLRNIIDTNPNWIFVKNQQGFYTLVNQAIAAAYGKTIEEVIGKTDRELLVNPEEAAQFGNDDQQVINLVEPLWIPEESITLPSGEQKILQTHKIPIAAPDGKSYEVLGVATDITDRKRAEEEIQKALQKEKELGEMKSQFVDIVSHEFRTPLTSILGFAELLDRHYFKLSKEKQLHYIRNIQQAGIRLKDLIDDVLCISRAESGRLAVMPTALNLNLFCQNLLEEFRFGSGKEHHFHFQVQGLSQENVRLDERLLRHILTNLLANAIKYSTAGSTVELELTWLAEVVQFQIRDRGIGIPLEDQLHLFESFHRASNVGDIPGTGLGLSIVKRYIELQAGSLEFISVVNEGTTFRVMLPFSPMP